MILQYFIVKEQLRELGFRLTELADLLHISRPTLYKYIELYESGEYDGIRGDVLMLFGYISTNPEASKRDILQYMVHNIGFLDDESTDRTEAVATVIARSGCSRQKLDLIMSMVSSDCLDSMVPYLQQVVRVLNMGDPTDSDVRLASKFLLFRQSVLSNTPVTEDQLEMAKRLI